MTGAFVTVIAEAGVNHNGSTKLALQLVDAAADAGADVVKFQTFKASAIVTRQSAKADYQTRTTDADERQLEMLRALELGEEAHAEIIARCKARQVRFLSTPFDFESLILLVDHFGLEEIKIGSGELTNAPLLLSAAQTGRSVILSTGMGTLGEIEMALGVLAFGYLERNDRPSRAAFIDAFASPEGRAVLAGKVTLLHCTTEYPAPFSDVNLRAMDTMRAAFGLPVGFSDHTSGIAVAIAAAARGATVIEKHLTLDRTMAGPDHMASLEPAEFAAMIASIRDVEAALGEAIKAPAPSERKNVAIARKSLVAAHTIAAGETFTPENLAIKRPGNGTSPIEYWDILGRVATRAFDPDESIS